MRRLVFIHGRLQQGKDADAMKAEWLGLLEDGLGTGLPFGPDEVRLTYYGDTLDQMTNNRDTVADVIIRGDAESMSTKEAEFIAAMLTEMAADAGVEAEPAPDEVIQRGILNWPIILGILRALDDNPDVSRTTIELLTRDVFAYLTRSVVRRKINDGVGAAIPESPSVVVAHSLGTVVAYDLITNRSTLDITRLVTLGSPLGVNAIKQRLQAENPLRIPDRVGSWFNAYDVQDFVALRPLDLEHFRVPGPKTIENYGRVKNSTDNHHGIAGYLTDPLVARQIVEAMTGEADEPAARPA